MRFWRRKDRHVEDPHPCDILAARYGHPHYLTESQKRAAIAAVVQEIREREAGQDA